MRLLLTRRWLGLAAVMVLVMLGCFRAGVWQFGRHYARVDRNHLVAANVVAPVVNWQSVLSPGVVPPHSDEWRRVSVTGTYDTARTVVIRNRSRDGEPGVELMVPLVTPSGPAVLVNRGWQAAARPLVPLTPPAGTVTLTGRIRIGEQLSSEAKQGRTEGPPVSVSRIDPARLVATLPYPAPTAYLEATDEEPAPAPGQAMSPIGLPEDGIGPHFAYGLQWWLFAVLAPVGYVLLVRRELRDRKDAAESHAREASTPVPADTSGK